MSFRGCSEFYSTDTSNSSSSDSDSDPENLTLNSIPVSINNSNNPLENLTMAVPVTPALKREYLDMIPEFHGEPNLLPRFIEICEKLVTKFYNAMDPLDFQNEYLMSSIVAKIKGKAAENILSNNVSTWHDLKNALVHCYADKRDCYTLTLEIAELKQYLNESPFEFYNRIQKLLNLQISYFSTHINVTESNVLSEFSRNLALRVLLRGLREPVGALMRTKNPENLNVALSMLTNDFQLDINPRSRKPDNNNIQKINHNNFKPFNQQNKSNNNKIPWQTPNQSNNRLILMPKPSFGNNSNQMANRNHFQPQQPSTSNPNLARPTPMSISTRNTYQPRPSYHQNYHNYNYHHPDPSQDFIIEELHNNEEVRQDEQQNNYPDEIRYPNEGFSDDYFLEEPVSDQNLK